MLRDLRPLRAGRTGGWPFGRRNRRVRATAERAPSPPPGGRASLRVLACLAIAVAIAGAGAGGRLFVLRSRAFALADVRVSPLKHLEEARIIAHSGLVAGTSLFALDLTATERAISREPWVLSVRVRRELPHTVAIDVVEREPRAAVALGPLYLVDAEGQVFKRARPDELAGLPVITGLLRDRFLAEPGVARAVLRRALELDRVWRATGSRETPGELHHDGGHDLAAAFTVYFAHGGRSVGVRLGAPDPTTPDRLRRLDAVIAALDREGATPAFIHLDQRSSLDRVAVRLASASDVTQAL